MIHRFTNFFLHLLLRPIDKGIFMTLIECIQKKPPYVIVKSMKKITITRGALLMKTLQENSLQYQY